MQVRRTVVKQLRLKDRSRVTVIKRIVLGGHGGQKDRSRWLSEFGKIVVRRLRSKDHNCITLVGEIVVG